MNAIGTPVVSAVITMQIDGAVKSVQIAKDDKLTDLTLANWPEDIVIASATVKGFQLCSLKRPENAGTIWDGVPEYVYDPDTPAVNPGSTIQMVEETTQVNRVIVEVPAATEGGDPTYRTIAVSSIKSFSGGTEIKADEGTTPPTDDGEKDSIG